MSGSTRSLELARGLVNAGFEVVVITTKRQSNVDYPIVYNGIRIIWLNVPYNNKLSFFNRILAFLKFSILSTYETLFLKYDLIYASSTPLTVLFPALIAHFFRNKKFYFEVRDLWPELPIAMGYIKNKALKYITLSLAKLGYKYAEKILPLSNDMAFEITKRFHVDVSKVYVLPNFSSNENFAFSHLEIEGIRNTFLRSKYKYLVIYPGTFGHVNGVEYILRIAEKLNGFNLYFLLIGDGREITKIRNILHESNLKNVEILQSVAKIDIYKYIASSDFLISTVIDIPELNWNSANKYFDGISANKPILINYGGWQAEELIKHNAGIVLDRNVNKACLQLSQISVPLYAVFKENVTKLAFKYQTNLIQKRLINIIKNENEISNLY